MNTYTRRPSAVASGPRATFASGSFESRADYHASEYLWGRRHKLSEAGLGLMHYALEGQGLGYLYETANVAAGFKTWLKYTHHQLGPEATRSCGVLGARLWTQVVLWQVMDQDNKYVKCFCIFLGEGLEFFGGSWGGGLGDGSLGVGGPGEGGVRGVA